MPSVYRDPDIADSINDELAQRLKRENEPTFRAKRKAAKAMLADYGAAVMGVMFTTRTADAIARFTGIPIGTVYIELQKLERAGQVAKTGEQLPDKLGAMHDVWRRVLPK